MDHLFLNETFETLWRGKDVFKEAFQLSGESFRKVKSRHTFRFELGEQGYFAKLHTGCGWKEIFKNLFQGKMLVLGASQEYKAIRYLEMIQVPTMKPCAYASK
ncbi:MAG TPA: lipopolysaccharide kinase InaA family protein, partial [Planctomycetota bacterium]|nr:lipopolysaccharide kinase InaA family protein [Planctomycetota bacterium]